MKVSKHIKAQIHKAAKLKAEANEIVSEIENYLISKGIDPDMFRGTSNNEGFVAPDYLTDLDYGIDVTDDLVAFLESEFKDF